MVLKPASWTPLTSLELGKVFADAGLPKGALNVVTGPGAEVGDELSRNPKVDLVSLTGDTATGRTIMAAASGTVKRVQLELGGKAPFIVFEDADIAAAVEGAVVAGFVNGGQDCTAATRLILHKNVRAKFVKHLLERVGTIRVGDPLSRSTDLGPLVHPTHQKRVLEFVEKGKAEGAKLLTGGTDAHAQHPHGAFVTPTVFDDVAPDMTIAQKEIFGPVLDVIEFSTYDEAIEIANGVEYGLAGQPLDERRPDGDPGGQRPPLRRCLGERPPAARVRDPARWVQAIRVRQGPRSRLVARLHHPEDDLRRPHGPGAQGLALHHIRGPGLGEGMVAGIPASGKGSLFIGGEWRAPSGGKYRPVVDPSTGRPIGEAPVASADEARAAIDAAAAVEESWGSIPGHERARILRAAAERIRADRDTLALLIAHEVGKPIKDARVEATRAAGVFQLAAEEIRHLGGESYPADAYQYPAGNEHRFLFSVRDPIGVVVAIGPFNFPLNLLCHKVAPALAAGNPVVAKPPSAAPFTALRLAEHLAAAGLPPGALNVVVGSGATVGDTLVEHPRTRLITFTGSTEVGKGIAEKAGRHAKRVILEMGGMDPFIVLDDAPWRRPSKPPRAACSATPARSAPPRSDSS